MVHLRLWRYLLHLLGGPFLDGKFAARPAVTITNNVGWYMDIAAQTAPDGVQVLAYTWGQGQGPGPIRRPGQSGP